MSFEKKSLLTWRVLRDQRSSDWLKATQALRAKAVSDQERNADNETKEDHSENIAKSQKELWLSLWMMIHLKKENKVR